MADTVTDPAMRAFRADLLAGGVLRGFAVGSAAAACGLLAARAFLSPLPPAVLALFAAVPACIAACALRALSRAPSRAKCLALVEDASHAGGLILSKDVPGAEAWPRPEPAAPEVPSTWRRAVPGALGALAALAAVAAAPDGWFAAGSSSAPAPAFPDVTTELRNELEDLRDAESLDEEEISALEDELSRIEREADPSVPGETLDAVDAVREKLAALLDIDAQSAKHLLPEHSSFASLATLPGAADQLEKMLSESSAGKCPNCGRNLGDGEGECDGNCCGDGEGEGEGEDEGEGEHPGNGGIDRGRGDAPLRFGDEAQLGESKLKDRAEKAEISGDASVTKVGESISEEDPAKNAPAPSGGGRRAIGGRNAGTSVNNAVLPRHRGTVRRFFDTERKQQ